MDERFDIKQREFKHLREEYKKQPDLFSLRTFVEDPETLSEFGIYIPGKEQCPQGFLKLWPQDFIVEEQMNGYGSSVTEPLSVELPPGNMVHATLVKCGVSTIEAIDDLAKKLGIPVTDIAYAGIKDKDAITAQQISIKGSDVEKVKAARSTHFFLKDVRMGVGMLAKGSLERNRFTIFIRTQSEFFEETSADLVARRLDVVQKHGFYNFFYLQRFGTPRLHNFSWARMILRGEYEKAVRDIIAYEGERELPYFVDMRRKLNANFGKWDEMLKLIEPMPLMFLHEHKLINHLKAHPGDFAGALQTIPEQIQLWMYALSSILFNQYITNCLHDGKEPPATLPFFLSRDRKDQEPYKDMLEGLGLYPPQFQHLKLFPHIQLRTRQNSTRDYANILKAEILKDGIVIEFELGKGQYATTFLSHLCNIVTGALPEGFSKEPLDTKATIGETGLETILDNFGDTIAPKGQNVFDEVGEA